MQTQAGIKRLIKQAQKEVYVETVLCFSATDCVVQGIDKTSGQAVLQYFGKKGKTWIGNDGWKVLSTCISRFESMLQDM